MKVILDGVFNHCGSFNKWMDRERIYENQEGYPKGAYISADSPYRYFFNFRDENAWPYNKSYDGWWTHDTLPKLNYEASRELYEYVLQIGRKWVSPPYNVDGWRLDVAADLGHSNEFNHQFWKDFRKAVKEANPNAIILAEHYGNPEGWLKGDEWDTVMNYDAFMEPITWFLTGMEKHSDEYREDLYGNSDAFISAMKTHMRSLHMSALYTAMNELSNHDHSRFLTRTNRRVGRISYAGAEAASQGINPSVMREAVVIQMTWPGAPTVYYGDEAGVCGFTDPDNRRTYPWGREDFQMLDFHRNMIRIHKRYKILSEGSVKFLWNDYQGLSYGRFSHDEQIIVILNNREEEREVEIPVWMTGISRRDDAILDRVMLTYKEGYTMEPHSYTAKAGVIRVPMPAFGAMVLHHKDEA
jgi:alpha-glucosidase